MKRVPNAGRPAQRERLGTECHLRPFWHRRKRPSRPQSLGLDRRSRLL